MAYVPNARPVHATLPRLMLAVAALAAAGSCGTAAPRGSPAGASPSAASIDAEGVRATERERLRALVAGDVETARRLHADDFQLVNPGGGVLTKEQYLGGIASGFLDYLVWEPDSIAVRVHGQAAVVRYRSQLEIVVQGQKTSRRPYWHTDLYERRDGRWQVVWSQATEVR